MKDSFGHVQFSSSQMTVAQIVVNYLNKVGLAAKGAARGNVPGTDQRHAMAYASTVDLEEAYKSGQMAALLAARGESGYMATILREPGPIYSVRYDKVPLAEVANSERTFPQGLDRRQRLRRDRRFRPLRAAAGRRRHDHPAPHRRPPAPGALQADPRLAEAADLRAAGRSEVSM